MAHTKHMPENMQSYTHAGSRAAHATVVTNGRWWPSQTDTTHKPADSNQVYMSDGGATVVSCMTLIVTQIIDKDHEY